MSLPRDLSTIQSADPPGHATFRFPRAIAWLSALILVAVVVAWGSAQLARIRAPWLLFPLAVGVVGGGAAGGLALAMQNKHRVTTWVGTALAAGLVVVGMHFQAYWAALDAPRSGQLEMFNKAFPEVAERHAAAAPAGFGEFLRRMASAGRAMPFGWTARGVWAWLSWGLDATILVGAAVCTAGFVTARPYCDTCGTYYRVIRRETLSPERFGRLARTLGWPEDSAVGGEYRHLACRNACGPDLVRASVSHGRSARYQAWIDSADRIKLFQQLDQSA